MSGPAGVLALVLIETAAGAAALLFLTPLWGEVKRGFFSLVGAVILVLALGAAASAAGGFDGAHRSAGRLADGLALAMGGLTLVWIVVLAARARPVARVVGMATVPLGVAAVIAYARTVPVGIGSAIFQLLAGALFMGAVLDGLLLGHWYLTDRRLPRAPIDRLATLLIAAVVVEAAGVVVGFGEKSNAGSSATSTLNPLLTVAGSASWIALGMVLCTGLIAAFIKLTLRGTRPAAVQSATGFFYLAVITAFTAELAAKVRFLP